MQTVFGHTLHGWNDFPDNQLLRCQKHKEYEAGILLNMPINGIYLDIGAHYGDSSLTLALYAKKNGRDDIKFLVFEPNSRKCRYIKNIAKVNKLPIKVHNICVGDISGGYANAYGDWDSRLGCCAFIESNVGKIGTICLDDLKLENRENIIAHIDVEGWESKVLRGAKNLINNMGTGSILIVECWSPEQSIERGFSNSPEKDILHEIAQFNNNIRLPDIIDNERNLVFKII
tara:strand:- start:9524 stop:10216 length:693 start_codon:yes stop_codon:yes gene_type:complete